jgi:adenylate kinase
MTDGVCDQCEGTLTQRPDDTPETVRHRLDVYRAQTEPLVTFYEGVASPLLRVNGGGELETVRDEIVRVVALQSKGV